MIENNIKLIITEKDKKEKEEKEEKEKKKEIFKKYRKTKRKKEKKKTVYRNKKERQNEVKNIILQLSDFKLNPTYEPIKKLYMLFKEYINEDRRIKINIPFPEINRRIKGLLAINKSEEVTIALINEKF